MDQTEKIHRESIVALCHEDVPIDIAHRRMNGEKAVMARIHLPRYKQGGVDMVVMAVGGTGQGHSAGPRLLSRFIWKQR